MSFLQRCQRSRYAMFPIFLPVGNYRLFSTQLMPASQALSVRDVILSYLYYSGSFIAVGCVLQKPDCFTQLTLIWKPVRSSSGNQKGIKTESYIFPMMYFTFVKCMIKESGFIILTGSPFSQTSKVV